MIIQPGSSAECLAAFRGIDGAEAVESAVRDRSQRNFSRCVPLSVLKRGRQAQLITAGKIRGHLTEEIRTKISVVVQKRAVRVVALSGEQGADLVLGGRKHENIALRVKLPSCCLDTTWRVRKFTAPAVSKSPNSGR